MKIGFNISNAITLLAFEKVLRLNPSAVETSNSVSPLNLIASDTKRFEVGVTIMHAIWVGPIVFVVVGWILWTQYGPEAMTGFLTMLLLSGIAGNVLNLIKGNQVFWY